MSNLANQNICMRAGAENNKKDYIVSTSRRHKAQSTKQQDPLLLTAARIEKCKRQQTNQLCVVATRGTHSKDNRNDNDKDEDDDDGAEKQLDDAAGAAAAEGVCVCVANRMKNIFLISCHQYQMKCYSAQAEASLLFPLLSSSFKLLPLLCPFLFAALTAL